MAFDPYKIVKYPLITEKGTYLGEQNKYVFCVNKRANKHQIKKAVETIYRVHVKKVNIINMPRKKKRYRFRIEGYTSGIKKAIVTLQEGERIAIT